MTPTAFSQRPSSCSTSLLTALSTSVHNFNKLPTIHLHPSHYHSDKSHSHPQTFTSDQAVISRDPHRNMSCFLKHNQRDRKNPSCSQTLCITNAPTVFQRSKTGEEEDATHRTRLRQTRKSFEACRHKKHAKVVLPFPCDLYR